MVAGKGLSYEMVQFSYHYQPQFDSCFMTVKQNEIVTVTLEQRKSVLKSGYRESTVFWHAIPHSLLIIYQNFGGIDCSCLQVRTEGCDWLFETYFSTRKIEGGHDL
jgi:hypothetical protein